MTQQDFQNINVKPVEGMAVIAGSRKLDGVLVALFRPDYWSVRLTLEGHTWVEFHTIDDISPKVVDGEYVLVHGIKTPLDPRRNYQTYSKLGREPKIGERILAVDDIRKRHGEITGKEFLGKDLFWNVKLDDGKITQYHATEMAPEKE